MSQRLLSWAPLALTLTFAAIVLALAIALEVFP